MQDLLYSFEKFALCQRCVVLPLERSNGLFQNWNKMRLSQWCGSGSGLSHKTWSHFRFAIFLIQDKTQVLQSSHSRLNSGENISKQIKIICFSLIFNFIALVFFSESWSQLNFNEFENSFCIRTLYWNIMLYLFAVSLVHMTSLCVLYGECRYIVMIKIYLCFPIC